MAIGLDLIHSSTFTQADGPVPGDYVVFGQFNSSTVSPETAFGVLNNELTMTAGTGTMGIKTLAIPASAFGSADVMVEQKFVNARGFPCGALMRMSEPVDASFNGYLAGRWGSQAWIIRVNNGVVTPLMESYRSILEATEVWMRARIEDIDVGGTPTTRIIVDYKTSPEGAYGFPAQYDDDTADRITAIGRVGIGTIAYYQLGSEVLLDDLVITGTSSAVSPVLSSPTAASSTTSSADGTVSTDTATGTLYCVATASATGPTAEQVEAGQDHTGATAAGAASEPVTASGVQNVNVAGLPQGTQMYLHYMHKNGSARSAVVTSAAFKTRGIGSVDTDNIIVEGQTNVQVAGRFGGSDPVVRIKSGGISVEQTDTAHTADQITISPITRGNLPYTDINHHHVLEVDTDE